MMTSTANDNVPEAPVAEVDVQVSDQGSIILFTPMSPEARDWFDENVQTEDWQWLGASLGVDRRYAADLLAGIGEAGLRMDGP
jgi:hypothetical protein